MATGKSLLDYLDELDVILRELDEFSDPVPLLPSPEKRKQTTVKLEQAPEKTQLAKLHSRAANMVLCQSLLSRETVQSDVHNTYDSRMNPTGVIIEELKRLSRVQRQNLEKFNFLTYLHNKNPAQISTYPFNQEPVLLSLWQNICETNTVIKNHTTQLYHYHLNQLPPQSPVSGLLWSVDGTEDAPPSELNLRQSSSKSLIKNRLQMGGTLSVDEKKEILEKTRKILKETFPKRDKPYSGRLVQGRMYEVVVQLALQKNYGEASVCDTNAVKANFPIFDLIWKEGDARRFVSLKCHLTKNAKERALQIGRDKRRSDEKLGDHPELLATAIYRHYQHLEDYLSSPVRRATQKLQQFSPDSPTYFDKCEGSYLDISDYASASQRFIVTRSTLKEAMKQDKATAKSLAAIDFSTEELQGFLDSLKEDISMQWEFGERESHDPTFSPDIADGRPKVGKARRRLSFV